MACASLIRPCSRVLVAGGTGIVGSGVVQELLKQGVKVIVGTRNMDNFNALYEQTPANLRCSLYASVGDVNTEEGAKSVFDQSTKDCAGVQHVVAALRGGKTSWECGRLWDQSLSQFFDGSREEVAGHFLLMKLFLPYLEFVAGSTYTMVTGYPGNACPAPGTPSTLLSLAFGTLGGLAESARIEQHRSKVAVNELHLKCIVLRELDNDVIGLGSQHVGHDLIGSVVTAVAGCGARRQVVIKGRDDALMWTKTESPSVQPKFPFIPPSSRPGCGSCR